MDPTRTPETATAREALEQAWREFIERRDKLMAQDPTEKRALDYYRRAHPLFTPAMAAALPPESVAGNQPDPICFYEMVAPPMKRPMHWYVMAATPDGDDTILFVYVVDESAPELAEAGYVSLKELRSIRGGLFLNIETVRYYAPERLSAVMARYGRKRAAQ